METDSLRCELRSQAVETVDDRQITTEANCVLCEVPDTAEERVNDVNITIDHHRIQQSTAEQTVFMKQRKIKGTLTERKWQSLM